MRVVMPDPYVADYPHLNGSAALVTDPDSGEVVVCYPHANVTPESVRGAIAERLGEIATWCYERMADLEAVAQHQPGALLDFDTTPPPLKEASW